MPEDSNKNPLLDREEEILKFWEENQIFKKSLEKTSLKGPAKASDSASKEFIFYDGPPFATGLPHYGHILAGTIKDVIPRFKTMQGYHVPRRWGWDCHGLPVENLVENELNLKSKKDIVDYGLDKFNNIASESVLRYADVWRKQVPRFGRFVDMDNDYRTMDWTYTESVWWAFKKLHEKGYLYEGFKSMHLCPRCETTLSNFEVAQGYKDVTDISVTVKFSIINFQLSNKSQVPNPNTKTYLLAWTTTPWTLPGNAALAVNSEVSYVLVKVENEQFIVAKDRVNSVFENNSEFEILNSEFRGSDLVGLEYEPLFNYYSNDKSLKNLENGWKVYADNFVSLQEGTGIVHIAPAFGSEDYELSRRENIPFIQHVDSTGKFKPEVKDFSGALVKPKEDNQKTDIEIIKHLAHKGLLFSKKKIVHSYPHCWRCDTPLINYASSSWFVKVSDSRKKLVSENDKIKWIPEEVGKYRFGNWLAEARDWSISRSRFWGAPIPVWKCDKCEENKFVGSVNDILESCSKSNNRYICVRHGEAGHNANNIISSLPENPHHLTEKGKEEVRQVAKKLKKERIDLVFASDYLRTKETAEILLDELGLDKNQIVYEKRIRETNTGDFNSKSINDYRNFFSSTLEKMTKRPPNGENLVDIKKRVGAFLAELDKKYKDKNILIVSHEYPIWMMEAAARGWDNKKSAAMKEKCDDYVETGSSKEIEFLPLPRNENFELELHRPFIDEIKLSCKCGGEMTRVPEVFDCWFESGSMPYGESHYPFENLDKFNPEPGLFKKSKGYPADFIAEGVDQTRGWFYSMLVLGTLLFDKSPYKNVIVNGVILAEDGQKMSKRLKNYPDPMEVVNKYGSDALRMYLLTSPVVRGQDLNFSEKGVQEVMQKILLRLGNVLQFYKLYENANIDLSNLGNSENVLDKWIVARLNQLVNEVTLNLENYELDRASRPINDFIDDLSTWFLRRSRDRFKNEENLEDKNNALKTTHFVLNTLAKIMAPFTPFFAEIIYQELNGIEGGKSVHLERWPQNEVLDTKHGTKILEDMKEVRRIVSLGLEQRAKNGIKVRQPLGKLAVKSKKIAEKEEFLDLIKDEVNVKEIVFSENISEDVLLDTKLTPELEKEGQLRGLIRQIQEMRKKKELKPTQEVEFIFAESERNFIREFEEEIYKQTKVKIKFGEGGMNLSDPK